MKKYIRKAYIYLFLSLVISIIYIMLDVYVSVTLGEMIDGAMQKDKVLFASKAGLAVIFTTVLLIFEIISNITYNLYKSKATMNLKYNYISKVFKKDINQFKVENNASYISSITNDIDTIEKDYIKALYDVIVLAFRLIITIILIMSISIEIFIFMIILGVISMLIAVVASIPMKKCNDKKSRINEDLVVYVREILNTFHVIKLNDLSSRVKEKYNNKVNSVETANSKIAKLLAWSTGIQSLISNLVLIGTFSILVYFIIEQKTTMGNIFVIAKNVQYVITPIVSIASLLPSFFSTKPIFNRLEESCKNSGSDNENIDLNKFEKEIRVNDISFSYEDKRVLNNVNLSFEKNKKYLLVGPSGCGKSTILNMLKKYITPDQGIISIDGMDLNTIKADSYFKHISSIEQHVFLFEDTLKNNITLYKNYTDDEINKAIDMSGLRSFVDSLPKKLDTIIYDNGKNISGGEKSRIAISRSLIMKCDVLILDEAFANLDYDTAKNIENTILSIPEITLINVSHVVFDSNKPLYDDLYVINR
ncbi:MAG: ABC transporter ATP-binding protein [Clostridium sp.]|uniref:ABC transporter ATP-binding protein n=1 Tax=Clostridium sp. TaxID=1506 RepID=UPI0030482B5B